MKNKQIRRILCLFFSLVLLISCVATPAYAMGEALLFATKSVAASLAVDGIINGLGVLPVGSEDGAFGTLVNNCVSALESATDFIVDGFVTVTGKPTATGYTSFLPLNMIQFVWEWLYDSGTVVENTTTETPVSNSIYGSGTLTTSTPVWLAGFRFTGSSGTSRTYMLICSDTSGWFQFGSRTGYYKTSHSGVYYFLGWSADNFPPSYQWLGDFSSSQFYSAERVAEHLIDFYYVSPANYSSTVGSVAAYQSPFQGGVPISLLNAPVYAPWTDARYSIPAYAGSEETVDGLPVSIPVSVGSTAQTQTGAQAGTNTLEDWVVATPAETTLTDILRSITSLPSAITGSIAQALSNFFSVSGTASNYGIQLKDFFPFCIPFDIYEFLTVLAAEPVAPVIEWEIPVPMLGTTYPLTVDLADWEPVAVIFRTFELLGFIIGLAIITRKNFLRS